MTKAIRAPKFDGVIHYTQKPVAGITLYGQGPEKQEPTLDEMLEKADKDDLRELQKEVAKSKLRARILSPVMPAAPPAIPKRYQVNPQTGQISVAEDGAGEYTMSEAVVVSGSIRGNKDPYEGVAKLLAVFKEDKPKVVEEPPKKKEFDVDDETGMIVQDPEHGELTLSEARAISVSRQRALAPRSEPITPEKLELMKLSLQEQWRKDLGEFTSKIKSDLTPSDEDPFTVDDKGDIQLNKKAKIPAISYLLFELIKQNKSKPEAATRDFDQWLETKKWEREEERKDQRSKAFIGLLEEGRKELPALAQGLRNISRSRETEASMKKGGWLGEGGPKAGVCPQCSSQVAYTSIPALVTCEKCGALNFFGSPEQLQSIRQQLAPPAPAAETKTAVPERGEKWQESATSSVTSLTNTGEEASREESERASLRTSKRSRKAGSGKKR